MQYILEPALSVSPEVPSGPSWIDELSDEQCMEIFWLYVEPPEEFLASHPPELLGAAMRYALRTIHAARPAGAKGAPSS